MVEPRGRRDSKRATACDPGGTGLRASQAIDRMPLSEDFASCDSLPKSGRRWKISPRLRRQKQGCSERVQCKKQWPEFWPELRAVDFDVFLQLRAD